MTDSAPEAVPADTKDWTWVLERPCPECGLDLSQVPREAVAGRVRTSAGAWGRVLERPAVRDRPSPTVWSPLEYGCHVRDVLRLYDERLQLMLGQDDPLYADWDQDATAVAERYGEQDPATVSSALWTAARTVADRFDGLSPQQWERVGRRSDGASFTVTTFALYFLHDVEHHLHDVR